MNKTKIILLSIAGVTLVGAGVLGYLVWDVWSAKGEAEENREYAEEEASSLMGQPIYPGQESVLAIESNRTQFVSWTREAAELTNRGDQPLEAMTTARFKSRMVEEAKQLSALPGEVEGNLVKADFAFGFNEYITGGQMPSQENLPRLQREWGDVSKVVGLLAKAGATSVLSLELIQPGAAASARPATGRGAQRPAPGRRNAPAQRIGNKVVDDGKTPLTTMFNVSFKSSAEALVNALNAFAADKRFIVVTRLSFGRVTDEIVDKLGGAKKTEEAAGGRGRGRGRRVQVEEKNEEEEVAKNGGVITDPQHAPALQVSMTVSVYDFRSQMTPAAKEGKED